MRPNIAPSTRCARSTTAAPMSCPATRGLSSPQRSISSANARLCAAMETSAPPHPSPNPRTRGGRRRTPIDVRPAPARPRARCTNGSASHAPGPPAAPRRTPRRPPRPLAFSTSAIHMSNTYSPIYVFFMGIPDLEVRKAPIGLLTCKDVCLGSLQDVRYGRYGLLCEPPGCSRVRMSR